MRNEFTIWTHSNNFLGRRQENYEVRNEKMQFVCFRQDFWSNLDKFLSKTVKFCHNIGPKIGLKLVKFVQIGPKVGLKQENCKIFLSALGGVCPVRSMPGLQNRLIHKRNTFVTILYS